MVSVNDSLVEFELACGVSLENESHNLGDDAWTLRNSLINEEFNEFIDEWFTPFPWTKEDVAKIAKEAADLVYVLVGTIVDMGINFDDVFAEVHRSNMSKFPASIREDGKILKNENYSPADILSIIKN